MYESALAGDLAGMFESLDEQVVVYEPSFLPYGGVTRGHQDFQKLLVTLSGYISLPTLKVDSLVADGDVVVAFLSASTPKGEPLSLCERSVVRAGRIVEMRIFYHEGGDLFPRASR
jgi:hypothetical protein